MAAATTERMTRIHQLDNKYQQGLHLIELINRDEEERRLSLKALALCGANAALEDLASERELHMLCLEERIEALKMELSDAKRRSSEQESRLQNQRDEIRSLKTDIDNLNSSAEASNGAMQDKVALTRELTSLCPELEQLKSQLASHQAVVASNENLRRQVDTLEVELENEKRSGLRAQQANEKCVISDLRSKLQQSEAKLNTERKEKENLKRELIDSRADMEQQKERFDDMKSKLKDLQNTLKDTQVDLRQSQRELSKIRETSTNIIEELQASPPNAKQARVIVEPQTSAVGTSLDDVDIQTPGDENIPEIRYQRRRGTEHALVGEKSNFSITPFLNKSRDATDYHDLDSERTASGLDSEVSPDQPRTRKIRSSQAISPVKARRQAASDRNPSTSLMKGAVTAGGALGKSFINESKASARPGARKRARLGKGTSTTLTSNNEEDSNTTSQKPELKPNATTEGDGPNDQGAGADGQRKRRKFLAGRGKTMFDDDEMDMKDNPNGLLRFAPAKRGRAQLGAVTNAFAGPGNSFSPLKKERRGANASFIG